MMGFIWLFCGLVPAVYFLRACWKKYEVILVEDLYQALGITALGCLAGAVFLWFWLHSISKEPVFKKKGE